ncbi:MAG: hypothetical protein JXR55_03860 [Candidatus Fermentibacteraceae bacterium]|nr:hypothetical protein [Candidatus Fermentibacteraceae bacterium]
MICGRCRKVHETDEGHCPVCGRHSSYSYDFGNSDRYLEEQAPRVIEERRRSGLEGLVGGLEFIVINTEPHMLDAAAVELAMRTGHRPAGGFQDDSQRALVLRREGSASIVIRHRKGGKNPFLELNRRPRSAHLPNTRLETLVFSVSDIRAYHGLQKEAGRVFATEDVQEFGGCMYLETPPSPYTGNALGLVQWTGERGDFHSRGRESLEWSAPDPPGRAGSNVGFLDHMATRVRAEDRDRAIIEFMELTSYDFDFSVYVSVFNSITNVARLAPDEFAMVFTSGIRSFVSMEDSGPTEKFIRNYGPRVHHMAFRTEDIEETYRAFLDQGLEFLIGLVGSEEEGLRQTFTEPSARTMLVNEYIHRYDGFDGFFTRSNITLLTGATDRQ